MKTINVRLRVPRLDALRPALLTIGGLGALTAAAWDAAGTAAGLAAGGVSLLLLEWLTRPTAGSTR